MSAKHFMNDPAYLVNRALHAVTLSNPTVALDAENKIVYLRPNPAWRRKVSIVSGGGSGHEPSFAGMVGPGLLSAAVAGTIFASPSAEQVRTAITGRVDQGGQGGGEGEGEGVLVTVMNYTGDILNFGVAVEQARASGVSVEMVVVADDVGVGRAKGGKVGRRGIAGTVLVHKISGALAARGGRLGEVAGLARLVARNLVSVGASLAHVHVPGREAVATAGKEEDSLAVGEVEIGMGIHNEPGSGRERLGLPALVGRMLAQLLDPSDGDRAFLPVDWRAAEVVLLVNNLGGVSVLEMGGITAEVVSQLDEGWGVRPVRILSGTYMTSLNGLGFSITLLNAGVDTGLGEGSGLVDLLDDPCQAVGWSAPISRGAWEEKTTAAREGRAEEAQELKESGLRMDAGSAQKALIGGLNRVIAAEPEVTQYDTVVGDGDCGIGLKRGAEAILKLIQDKPLTGDAAVDVARIVPVVESHMDGTSGALYAIFLNSLVRSLRDLAARGEREANPKVWAEALKRSSEALSKYTPARPGDRTLVDALHPFVETLGRTGSVDEAVEAGRVGAAGTKGMRASLGRSVYVGGSGFEQVPDPGAWGLACFFLGLSGK